MMYSGFGEAWGKQSARILREGDKPPTKRIVLVIDEPGVKM
jgi:hypothetical protein